MKFGPIPVQAAEGAILAHSLSVGTTRLRKARRLTADDIALLQDGGIAEIVVAKLDADDVDEDAAAEAIVSGLRFPGISARPASTGRVNLHADAPGILTVDAGLIDAINAVDPAITIATLAHHAEVEQDRMVATVKIIPYAVSNASLKAVLRAAGGHEAFRVHPFKPAKVAVIQTTLPSLKDSVLDKTARITETRLSRSASTLAAEERVAHETGAVAAAARKLAPAYDMLVIFGASAVSDFEDVIPAAIKAAGGEVIRTGMPVDPGNLLVLGRLAGKPVIGAPGCARSPKENGFDWVLGRTLAGIEITDRDIAGMGVGGLLMEIGSRPQPREPAPRRADPKVYAVLLGAGRSSRMAGPNKLMAQFDGKPLVRRTAERAIASLAENVILVTGHQADRVITAVDGLGLTLVHNADFASGLSSSLRQGIASLPVDAAGALVVLGDMPAVTSADLDILIAAFRKSGGQAIVRATHNGKRGNPVILPRTVFGAVAALQGDTGARHIVESGAAEVIDVELGMAASLDVDTPEAMRQAGGILETEPPA